AIRRSGVRIVRSANDATDTRTARSTADQGSESTPAATASGTWPTRTEVATMNATGKSPSTTLVTRSAKARASPAEGIARIILIRARTASLHQRPTARRQPWVLVGEDVRERASCSCLLLLMGLSSNGVKLRSQCSAAS